jgi:5-histidylcysteine sulfoxide synthase
MDSAGWAIVMGFEHERIHLETSSVLMRELPAYLLTRPTEFPKLHPSAFGAEPARAVKNAMVENAGGRVALGKPRDFPSFGWDNEYGARDVEVAPFKASKFLITNGEFLEFVCAGGYTDRASWTDAGWQWRVFRNVLFPTFWVPDGPVGLHQYKLRCIYEVVDLPLSWPVEVNAHEAQAFCRWRTALERPAEPYRLVTEGEHHCLRDAAGRAADPLTDPAGRDFVLAHAGSGAGNPHNANLRWSSASPVDALPASSSGCHDVMGNVWHWLEDDFNPLEGFEVHPMYMDFSTPCMDGLHTMIVGGSYISTGDEASVWSRFHFRPHFNQHSGFRIAAGPNRAVLLPKQGTNGASVAAAPAIPARTVDEHMLFHYGGRSDVCPYEELLGPAAAASFPTRVAKLLVDACAREGVALARALELGCAVGGASFALAERFESVVGVDRAPFVAAAEEMRVAGQRKFLRHEEGEAYSELVASCTKNVDRRRVTFHAGDPGALPAAETGALFDAVLLHTVLDRVADPAGCLARLAGPEGLVRPGGLLLIAHAGGWSDAHAPAAEWLGGYTDPNGRVVRSLEGISQRMPAGLRMLESCDLPKVVREDARHFRLEVVEVSLWRRDA